MSWEYRQMEQHIRDFKTEKTAQLLNEQRQNWKGSHKAS